MVANRTSSAGSRPQSWNPAPSADCPDQPRCKPRSGGGEGGSCRAAFFISKPRPTKRRKSRGSRAPRVSLGARHGAARLAYSGRSSR